MLKVAITLLKYGIYRIVVFALPISIATLIIVSGDNHFTFLEIAHTLHIYGTSQALRS